MKGLQLILAIIFCDRERDRLSRALAAEHTRRIHEAAIAMRKEMDRNGNKFLKASKTLFHSKCRKGFHHGCSNDEFAKEVTTFMMDNKQDYEVSGRIRTNSSGNFEDVALEKSLKKELIRINKKRNDAAYELVQQYFARAHLKRAALGESSLDVTERLLCDYESVTELQISSDAELLFKKIGEWLEGRKKSTLCRTCEKKTASIKCGTCKHACFCSIACQVRDEGNKMLCHAHECDLLTQLKEV